MRTLATFAITVAMAFMASSASAISTINLDYVGGSTAGAAVGSAVDANLSDVLTFDISVSVDSNGIGGLGFDLQWNNNSNFDVQTQNWVTGTKFASFAPLQSYQLLTPLAIADIGGDSARIRNIGFFSLTPPFNTSVFIGTVTFHVGTTAETLVSTGFFATDGSSASNGLGTFTTPSFTSFTVNAPEPGLAALMGLGLAGLALAGRRKK